MGVTGDVEPPAELGQAAYLTHHGVAGVAVASAHHGEIDGEHQHRGPDRGGPSQKVSGERTIPHHVELEPRRSLGGGGHLLEAADGHRGLHERHPGGRGGPGRMDLGPGENIPASPTGPRMTGMARSWPSTRTAWPCSLTSRITRCRSVTDSRSVTLAESVDSS